MSKKKGFTLVELLAVLAIIGLVATLASTSVISILNKNKKTLVQEMEEKLKDAAISYVEANKIYLSKCTSINISTKNPGWYPDKCYKEIQVGEIINQGLFTDDNGYCDKTASVVVYKELVNNQYLELNTYIKEGTCK